MEVSGRVLFQNFRYWGLLGGEGQSESLSRCQINRATPNLPFGLDDYLALPNPCLVVRCLDVAYQNKRVQA